MVANMHRAIGRGNGGVMKTKRELIDVMNDAIEFALSNLHTATIAKVTGVQSKTISVQPVINRVYQGRSIALTEFVEVPPVTFAMVAVCRFDSANSIASFITSINSRLVFITPPFPRPIALCMFATRHRHNCHRCR